MNPREIVETMMSNDRLSQWLGIEVVSVKLGTCTLKMTVTEQMVNGFNIAHGGITYSLSDSALAFASNSYGPKCVSIETSIHHLKKVESGDEITATCTEIHRGRSIALYQTEVHNSKNELVSFFKGQVKISKENW